MRLVIPVTDRAIEDIADVVQDNKENPKELRPDLWLYQHALRPIFQQTSEGRNLLATRGSMPTTNGRTLNVEELASYRKHLISPQITDGMKPLEIRLGEFAQKTIEDTVTYIIALNKAAGSELVWTEPWEWVRETILSEIARAKGRIEGRLLDEEQSSTYPGEEHYKEKALDKDKKPEKSETTEKKSPRKVATSSASAM